MTEDLLKHISDNIDYLQALIDSNSTVHFTNLTRPILSAYTESTGDNVTGCNDCRLDGLRWAIRELNKSKAIPAQAKVESKKQSKTK